MGTTTRGINNQCKTGEILAMVGSSDYYDEEIDGNKCCDASASRLRIRRLYIRNFACGFGPGSAIGDVPTKVERQAFKFDGKF